MKFNYFTDAISGNKVAINKDQVIAVFEIKEGEHIGKTYVGLTSGQIFVEESDYDVVAVLNA